MSVVGFVWALHVIVTFCLVGLIWTVQLVHYPTFAYVDAARFVEFEAFHQRRISWVVAPLMVVELFTGIALLVVRPEVFPLWAGVFGLVLIGGVWLSTFLVQVPLHGRLGESFNADTAAALVRTNWVRTVLWSLRGLLIVIWLGVAI